MSYENAARQQSGRKWWLRVVGILACIVVFVTVYALVLPAATLEGTPTCGLEEHTHADACYDADGVLTCTLEEHVHDQACYAEEAEEPDAEESPAEEPDASGEPSADPAEQDPVDKDEEDLPDAGTVLAAPPLLLGSSAGSIVPDMPTGTTNDWQIVSGKFEGNSPNDKTPSPDGSVRIQKNVIPTDTENEFLVYLSIDTKQSLQSYFELATYYAKRNKDNSVGKVVDSIPQAQSTDISSDPNCGYPNSGIFDIVEIDKNTGQIVKYYAKDIKLYWSDAQNVTIYVTLDLPSGTKYLVLCSSIKEGSGNHYTLDMTDAKTYIEQLTAAVDLTSVVDTMGDKIKYVDVVNADGTVTPSGDGRSITWKPDPKSNPEKREETVEVDGVTTKTTWYLNVAELVYKVKLDVSGSFNSCANNMNSNIGDPESYKVNNIATLTYDKGQTVDFPVPYVRGLLYDIQGIKVAKGTDKPLDGAQFTLKPGDITATSGKDGTFSFQGLAWGDYTVKETQAPQGYRISTDPVDATLCYTTTPDVLKQSTADNTHLMLKDEAYFKFVDELIQPTIVLVKHDEGSNVLPGASFEVTGPKSASGTSAEETGVVLTIPEAPDGDYKVVETEAPNGYNLLADEVKITVSGTDVKAFVGSKELSGQDLTSAVDSETGVTTVTIVLHNNSGVVLPETGGVGTILYTVSGLALIASAGILLVIRRRKLV